MFRDFFAAHFNCSWKPQVFGEESNVDSDLPLEVADLRPPDLSERLEQESIVLASNSDAFIEELSGCSALIVYGFNHQCLFLLKPPGDPADSI